MEEKSYYLVVYGKNQTAFPSLELMIQFFQECGNLFDSIIDDCKFYEVNVKQIKSPLK